MKNYTSRSKNSINGNWTVLNTVSADKCNRKYRVKKNGKTIDWQWRCKDNDFVCAIESCKRRLSK